MAIVGTSRLVRPPNKLPNVGWGRWKRALSDRWRGVGWGMCGGQWSMGNERWRNVMDESFIAFLRSFRKVDMMPLAGIFAYTGILIDKKETQITWTSFYLFVECLEEFEMSWSTTRGPPSVKLMEDESMYIWWSISRRQNNCTAKPWKENHTSGNLRQGHP